MRKFKWSVYIVSTIMICLTLSSCSKEYIVSYDIQDGNIVDSIETVNQNVTIPIEPNKLGYTFNGWYTDLGYNTRFNFNSKVESDMTLYAKWVYDEESMVLFPFIIDDKYGFLDFHGNIIVEPIYDEVGTFRNGYVNAFIYDEDNRFLYERSVINSIGETVVTFIEVKIERLKFISTTMNDDFIVGERIQDEISVVEVYNSKGELYNVFDDNLGLADYNFISESLLPLIVYDGEYANSCAYYNVGGSLVLDSIVKEDEIIRFKNCYPANEGHVLVTTYTTNDVLLINLDDNSYIDFPISTPLISKQYVSETYKYYNGNYIQSGLICGATSYIDFGAIEEEVVNYKLISLNQEVVYQTSNEIISFNDGIIVEYTDNKEYIIRDVNGNIIIDELFLEFDDNRPPYLTNDLIVLRNKDGYYGAVDYDGNIIIQFIYDDLGNFNNDYTVALLNGSYGIISKTGDTILDFTLDNLVIKE